MSRRFWSGALHIYIPSLLMMLGQGMLIPALPTLAETYAVSGALAVQVVTIQQVGRFAAFIPTGAVIDRLGAKPPMVFGAFVSVVCLLGAAAAPNFVLLLATQFVWGFGQNMWMFGREIAAAEMVSAEQRGRAMSTLMGISGVGMAMGPAIGGFLTEPVGVRGLFLIFAGISAVILVLGIMHKAVRVERPKGNRSMFNFTAFKEIHPYFRLTYFILFISTFGVLTRTQVTNTMLPLYVESQLGYSPAVTGLLFTVHAVATFAIIMPAGFVSDKRGRKWVAAPSALIAGLTFLVMPFADYPVTIGAVLVFMGFASGMAMGSMTTYTFDIVPVHLRGQLQALRRSFGEVGAVTGPLIAGGVASVSSPSVTFWVFFPLLMGAGLALVFFAREGLPGKRAPGAPPPAAESVTDR
ncbi:MAG: MFS transporter [Chloroflexi bacterium]|nr:MFS transporter [Chloroflexota bacterium]